MELKPSPVDREAVDNFRWQATEFCKFIGDCAHFESSSLVHALSALLLRVCLAAVSLPEVQPATSGGYESSTESVEEHSKQCVALATRLRKQLGSLDEYSDVFDPTEEKEAIRCSRSMDLADIYMDLKEATALDKNGVPDADVLWQWRFDFLSHWSRHAAGALKVLLILSARM